MVHTLTHGNLVIYDTEWTSWPGFMESGWKQPGRHPEIIQIGAVKLNVENDFEEIDAFQCFIKPRINPTLSEYIIELTGISQKVIDERGIPFEDALNDFVTFLGNEIAALMSFGKDRTMVEKNCELNNLTFPSIFHKEQNLRLSLENLGLIKPGAFSSDLPTIFGLTSNDRAHNALGDARAQALAIRHLRQNGHI